MRQAGVSQQPQEVMLLDIVVCVHMCWHVHILWPQAPDDKDHKCKKSWQEHWPVAQVNGA
jgi:hypothetical protein